MANSHPKPEPMETSTSDFDPVNLESEIIQLCLQFPNGVTDKILENSFRSVTLQQRVSALNRLLSLNKIDLLKSTTELGTLIYRIRDTTNASSSSISIGGGASDQMERVVYQLVKESGNLGIWMRDIRTKTKLSQTILTKTLKALESKKLIKAVKAVHASKKKVRELLLQIRMKIKIHFRSICFMK
jgi:DNA-directed RNA polymerase III subunit RPC6